MIFYHHERTNYTLMTFGNHISSFYLGHVHSTSCSHAFHTLAHYGINFHLKFRAYAGITSSSSQLSSTFQLTSTALTVTIANINMTKCHSSPHP